MSDESPILEFFDATAGEILDLPRDRTLFLFSIGPLEDHGRHLPLGTDILGARALALETARRLGVELPGWRAVLMPPLPGGIDSNTTRLALTVRPHVVRDWLVDHCLGLSRHGFRYFAIVSGNRGPKQLTAMEEAGRLLTLRAGFFKTPKPRLISLSSGGVSAKTVWLAPFWPNP
ncbi:MAG: creatininase family protein, partial [Bdellovibrionota bacterium]